MYFPRRAGKRNPKIVKSQNVRILLIVQWFYPFPYGNSLQKTLPMNLNTSPTSFEGSGTGKHKTKHEIFKKLKACPETYWQNSIDETDKNCKLDISFIQKTTDLFSGAFSENVFSPEGAQKSSQKWVCLAGKIWVRLAPSFCPIVNTPNANKTKNPKNDRELI